MGKDSLFVELQDHGIADQRRTNPQLIEIARRLGAPLLATNDSHYTHREDAVAHDALLCVQTGATIDDPKRFKFEGTEHYLKTAAEMRHLFDSSPRVVRQHPAHRRAGQRRDRAGSAQPARVPGARGLPGATYDEQAMAYLRHLTYEGARRRYGDPLPDEVRSRIDYELGVIGDMGFAAYFLVVWDLIRFARESGIRVGPGRGSAAGCCVAYCLRIVDLDPIRYDLLFERFLNPGRKQMPDIDMDFDERFRGDMIRYAAERYGSDRVAQIVTFSTIKARAAVRDAARVLGPALHRGRPHRQGHAPPGHGSGHPAGAPAWRRSTGHEDGYGAAAELRTMYETDPEARQVIDVAKGLEGLRRQDGIHAAAVVITKDPLTEYLPIQRKPDAGVDPEDAPIVTQYEMHGVEELGLLKMDFLGLRNLSVIERALDLIQRTTGGAPTSTASPWTTRRSSPCSQRGESIGVFQLEGRPMRSPHALALADLDFDDVAALVALYRPGPMAANMHNDYADRKNGRKQVTYLHPDLEPILGDTQGLMIYQESVMRVAQKFAGYTLEEADNLRKACGKKIRALIAAEREKFVAGCVAQGYGEQLGTQLFDIIEPFADYAFNKSHSYGYGLVAYQTAWLKAHYPVEYMAALLTRSRTTRTRRPSTWPSAGPSASRWSCPTSTAPRPSSPPAAEDRASAEGLAGAPGIVFGLAAVRNVGESLVERIVAERDARRAFSRLLRLLPSGRPDGAQQADDGIPGQGGRLRFAGPPPPGVVPGPRRDRRPHPGASARARRGHRHPLLVGRAHGRDRRRLGALGGHPGGYPRRRVRQGPAAGLREGDARPLRERPPPDGAGAGAGPPHRLPAGRDPGRRRPSSDGEPGSPEGMVRSVGGVVTELKRQYTKKGDLMARFMLEDLQASMEVFVFPRVMAEYGALLENDAVIVLRGRVDLRDEQPKIVCMEVRRPLLEAGGAEELRISLPLGVLTDQTVGRLKEILVDHPGGSPGDAPPRAPRSCACPRSSMWTAVTAWSGS